MKLSMIVLACLVIAQLQAAELKFSKPPEVKRSGEQWFIDFALSEHGDVEVAVLNAQGKIVRHLAAGVLGGVNSPPEPLKMGLAQSLVWDGKDDQGKAAQDAPFSVRVRAGMSVKFGKIIGSSPYTGSMWTGFPGLAVAPDGMLYVKLMSAVGGGNLHVGYPWQLRRFDQTGKYQKTLLPYPPSTPLDKTSGFKLIDAGDGLLTPSQSSGLDAVLYNLGDSIYCRVVDGNVIFVDKESTRLTFFKIDGSNAIKSIPVRTAPDKFVTTRTPELAFSADGKYAYYSNAAKVPSNPWKHPKEGDPLFPQGRIYRQDLTKPGSNPEKFYDLELPDYDKQKYWLPDAWNNKTAAAGIDVDAQGHVFVCDLVNQEIVELSPEGKKLNSIKVPWPDKVKVNSKTGTLYVISLPVSQSHPMFRPNAATLLKVTGRGADGKVSAKLPLKGIPPESLALDDSGAVPALWLGGDAQLIRVEDQGAEFGPASASLLNPDKDVIDFVCYGDVDTDNEDIYITSSGKIWRFNGETGVGGRAPINGVDVAVAPGGNITVWSGWAGQLKSYTRDYKPALLASTGKDWFGNATCRQGRGASVGGLDFNALGQLYVTNGCNSCLVQVYEADGKPVEYERKAVHGQGGAGTDIKTPVPALVTGMTDTSGSVRADAAGNVYVLQHGLPKGHVSPKGFEKDPAYQHATGTIYKFGPKGGEFQKDVPVGHLRSYNEACGQISGPWSSTSSCCHCTKPRFDVDAYGRLYIPNGYTYKVSLVDNADNTILTFGGYGNWDAQGPKSSEPKPEIPLGSPVLAGASDKYIYVGDALNHRVVRADKVWAAEAVCVVK